MLPITVDGAIVTGKNGELIVRDFKAVFRWINNTGVKYGIAGKNRVPLFVAAAEHFGCLTLGQATSLREQLGG